MSTGNNGNGRQSIIVIGAHPDDAEIGAGGTMAAYAKRGHRVVMVNVRVPGGGRDDHCHDTRKRRRCEADVAAEALGVELVSYGLSRRDIHDTAGMVSMLDELLADVRPHAVYTHWVGDTHPEHISLSRAVFAATRRNRCSVYMYEATLPGGISAHSFRAQKYVDITDTIEEKMKSLEAYETQVASYGQGWLDAIRGRAAWCQGAW